MSEPTIFQKLASIDVSKQTEDKKGLKYLSWSFAWSFVKTTYPNAKYKVINFVGKPYLFDENLGYLVATEVTINDETIQMQLPVMNAANMAQRHIAYKQWNKDVLPATMFDINTAIMRCLVKNLAMFGLGISLYSGEDLPEIKELKIEENKLKKTVEKKPPAPLSKNTESVENEIATKTIYKLENNLEIDTEKAYDWLFKNQSKISESNFSKITNLLLERENQNKTVNIEPNLDKIADEVLANFDPNYTN